MSPSPFQLVHLPLHLTSHTQRPVRSIPFMPQPRAVYFVSPIADVGGGSGAGERVSLNPAMDNYE
jgi:hypothetical protein